MWGRMSGFGSLSGRHEQSGTHRTDRGVLRMGVQTQPPHQTNRPNTLGAWADALEFC